MMKRVLVAAAAVTAATLGLALPGVASAGRSAHHRATRARAIRREYDRGRAGYAMSGGTWRFRYLATTLTVPACSTRAESADITFFWEDLDAVALRVKCGGGAGSVGYDISTIESKTLALRPRVGDRVTISIHHDRFRHRDRFTAVDHTTGVTSAATESIPTAWTWDRAEVIGRGPLTTLAPRDSRLWAFTDTQLVSYRGRRGAIRGPWPTYRIIGTTTGTAKGAVVLWPRWPWNHSRNFSVWWSAPS